MDVGGPAGSGWEPISDVNGKLKNVVDQSETWSLDVVTKGEKSPSGFQHLQVLPAANGIKQDITEKITDVRYELF